MCSESMFKNVLMLRESFDGETELLRLKEKEGIGIECLTRVLKESSSCYDVTQSESI